MVQRTLVWQRDAVTVALVGALLVIWPDEGDVFSLLKATWIVLVSILCLGVSAGRILLQRRVLLPRTASFVAAGVFFVGLLVTTLTSTTPMQSLVGQYAQFAGFGLYTACVVLFASTLGSHDVATLPRLVQWVVAATALVVLYGFLQRRELDPFGLGATQVVATMGNPNFLAGWLGATFPLCLGLALFRSQSSRWRLVGGVTALLIVPLSVFTASFQGPMTVGFTGVAFVVLLLLTGGLRVPGALRGWRGPLVVLVLLVLVAPFGFKVLSDGWDQGMRERRYFWQVAVEVFTDHPVVGTGPDTFHNEYLPRRPAEHAALPASKNAGAAHSVPLDMFANGGLALGVPYLAFVLLVGWRLVLAVRRRAAPPWLLAGVGAAWLGYQLQSLVSIDKPPLAALHWVLAGAVVVLGGPLETRTVDLPGEPARRVAPPMTVAAIAGVVVVVLGLSWVTTRPMRADLAANAAKQKSAAGDAAGALAGLERARDLAPWEARYTFDVVRIAERIGDGKRLVEAAEAGARLEPGDSSYTLVAAGAADAAKKHDRATEWYDEALRIDPFGLDPLLQAADSAAKAGEEHRAAALLERVEAVTRGRADIWMRVGVIREKLGDDDGARRAFRAALDLEPTNELAEKRLEELAR